MLQDPQVLAEAPGEEREHVRACLAQLWDVAGDDPERTEGVFWPEPLNEVRLRLPGVNRSRQ
jgi:hypothetical protein